MKTLTRFMGETVDCPFQAQMSLLGEIIWLKNAFTVESPITSTPRHPKHRGGITRVLPKTFASKSTPTLHTQ